MASMLGLCEAQMDSALQESDHAVDALIQAFTSLVETTRSVGTLADHLPAELRTTVTRDLDSQLGAISKQMASAVIAFQFYDKLTQRLGHVRYSLSTLSQLVCDRGQSGQPEQWRKLHATLRGLYRTEEEREVFQMMVGPDAADAASGADEAAEFASSSAKAGEVELF